MGDRLSLPELIAQAMGREREREDERGWASVITSMYLSNKCSGYYIVNVFTWSL